MRILFLARWFPYPADNGARLRTLNVLRQLARKHTVHLVACNDSHVSPAGIDALRAFCASVDIVPWRSFQPRSARALLGYLSPQPRFLVQVFSREAAARIAQLARTVQPDAVIGSTLEMAMYARQVPARFRMIEELEVGIYKDAAEKGSFREKLTWLKLRQFLPGLLRQFNTSSVVSERERELVAPSAPSGHSVIVVPNGIDPAQYAGITESAEPGTLIYAGALTYQANFDAVQHFLADIYPRIRSQYPSARFTVTGSVEGVDLSSLRVDDSVTFTGRVPDIRPLIARSWISVVPLRVGGGTRLKVLESLALGAPVISTRKGAEGLELTDGEHLLLADNAEAFADAVLRVLCAPELRGALADRGRAHVLKRYDWGDICAGLDTVLTTQLAGAA